MKIFLLLLLFTDGLAFFLWKLRGRTDLCASVHQEATQFAVKTVLHSALKKKHADSSEKFITISPIAARSFCKQKGGLQSYMWQIFEQKIEIIWQFWQSLGLFSLNLSLNLSIYSSWPHHFEADHNNQIGIVKIFGHEHVIDQLFSLTSQIYSDWFEDCLLSQISDIKT